MENGNLIVLLHPEAIETMRETIDPVAELPIGPSLPPADDCVFLGKELLCFSQGFGQNHLLRSLLLNLLVALGQILKPDIHTQNAFDLSHVIPNRPRKCDAEGTRML